MASVIEGIEGLAEAIVEGKCVDGFVTESESAEETDEEIVVADEETMTIINTVTGEVMGIMDTPPEDAPVIDVATWMGDRRDWHKGKLAGLMAEKQSRVDTLNRIYDPQIKRHQTTITFLEKQYSPMLLDLARRLIGAGKKRSTAVGLLLLKLRKTRAGLDIVDVDRAVSYFRVQIQKKEIEQTRLNDKMNAAYEEGETDTAEALKERLFEVTAEICQLHKCINVKESIYKSEISESMKKECTEDKLEETGMKFDEGGVEYLELG